MLTLIKNAEVYTPEPIGVQQILLSGGKIIAIEKQIDIKSSLLNEVDATGKIVIPGLIDSLVHITGGGGEGGYSTRTPEVSITDLTTAGITTLVAALGTDSVTRSLASMLAKAKELNHFGLNCFIYSGSYHFPIKTITNDLQSDLVLINECIGVGEVAIADNRGSQPNYMQLASLASDAKVGGMLSGKSGIVSIHMGPSKQMFQPLYEVVEKTDVSIKQFYPTHINRNQTLLDEGIKFVKAGGFIDLTTSSNSSSFAMGEIKCSKALKHYLQQGAPIEQITFSSDGHASLPEFNEQGELTSLEVGDEKSLFVEVRDAVLKENIPLETAIKVVTSTPASILKLGNKGKVAVNADADLILLTKQSLEIDTVISSGITMVEQGSAIVKGTFEYNV